jgi:signal peptidase I
MKPRLSSGRRLMVATVAAGLLGVITIAFAVGTHGIEGLRVARVRGTSMHPTLRAGDLVVVRRRPSYDVGQVVAYRRSGGEMVIHRVVSEGGDGLRLKGDNNPAADPDWIAVRAVSGHEVLHIPQGFRWLTITVVVLGALALGIAWSARSPRGGDRPDDPSR